MRTMSDVVQAPGTSLWASPSAVYGRSPPFVAPVQSFAHHRPETITSRGQLLIAGEGDGGEGDCPFIL